MALEIRWSKKADNRFVQILEYLQVEWGEKVTSAFVKRVFDYPYLYLHFTPSPIGTSPQRGEAVLNGYG